MEEATGWGARGTVWERCRAAAASTRREGREGARGAGWRLDRASMTSSPPSPTEVAGLERREAGRGPAGSVSQGEAGADGAGSVPDLRRPSPFPACSRLLCRHALAAAAPSQFISFEWARESAFPQGLGLSVGLAFGRRRVSLGVCCFS